MSDDADQSVAADDVDSLSRTASSDERRLQTRLESGTITDAEYARLTALRFGKDPEDFTFADAAEFYDLTQPELREEMAWLSAEEGPDSTSEDS